MTDPIPSPTPVLRVPATLLNTWAEIQFSIKARLSERHRHTLEEISPSEVVAELLRIALDHIHGQGYPEPGDAHMRAMQANAQLQELVEANNKVLELEARLADVEAQLRDRSH